MNFMALGGGMFFGGGSSAGSGSGATLPGAYLNFVSLKSGGKTLSDRGAAGIGLNLDWGREGEVFLVNNYDFLKNSLKIFGYDYSSDNETIRDLREVFLNAESVYCYRLNSGGKRAECEYCKARYTGTRGNDIRITIEFEDEDVGTGVVVKTLVDNMVVDEQLVTTVSSLVDNDFVIWKDEGVLTTTAGMALTGGTSGDDGNVFGDTMSTVNTAEVSRFLDKITSYPVNVIGVKSNKPQVNKTVAEFVKKTRDNIGIKLCGVVYDYKADHEGVINVKNSHLIIPWVMGALCGCNVNESCLNKVYDGEYEIEGGYTQDELKKAIEEGFFTLHNVNDELRVLSDISSLTTFSSGKGSAFRDNQTVRVIDCIATDIANLFSTKYLGSVANDSSGRISLWADIVKHHEGLQRMRAIEDFSEEDVEVIAGDDKRSVIIKDKVSVVNAMAQIFMTCVIA